MGVKENYNRVRGEISDFCREVGRDPADVRLLVASKGRAISDIELLHDACGQRDFGENYLGELQKKSNKLKHLEINWIFVGALQSNKIGRLVALCTEIQSVSSVKHARYVDRYAVECGKTPFPIYLAVNSGGELQKSGVGMGEVARIATEIVATCPNVALEGIMAIPPAIYNDRDWRQTPPLYEELAKCGALCGGGGVSLGMSGDLKLAIMAGSTCVRVGRSIFSN